MPDFSPGLVRLAEALGGGKGRQSARSLVNDEDRGDLYRVQAELTREKILDAISKRKNEERARIDADPENWVDLMSSASGAPRETAQYFVRQARGTLPTVPPTEIGDPDDIPQPRPQGLTPEVEERLRRAFTGFRGQQLTGGNIQQTAKAIGDFQEQGLRDEAAGSARGGDVPALNRIMSVISGKANEPFSSSQFGPYNQETGELTREDIVNAATGLSGSKAAAADALVPLREAQVKQSQASAQASVARANRLATAPVGRGGGGGRAAPRQSAFQQRMEEINRDPQTAELPTPEKLALASGRRPVDYAAALDMGRKIAKDSGLTGTALVTFAEDYAGQIQARNRGDSKKVDELRGQSLSRAAAGLAEGINSETKPARRDAKTKAALADLAARGYTKEQAVQALRAAGVQ